MVDDTVMQDEMAITREIDIDNLDVGIAPGYVVLTRQCAAYSPITTFIVDRVNLKHILVGIVDEVKEPPPADQGRAQKLRDETLVTIIGPGILQDRINFP